MRAVRYLDEARAEFLHEVQYFTSVSPRLGERFDKAVRRAEVLVAEFADIGSPYKYGTRRVFPGKFKFSLVYLTRLTEIVVIAVAPFKRKPGYWRARLGTA
ncbi:MAG: type II toxin-antitoxin system RelE/ParE family toxin [Rubrivivax sp.]